MDVGKKILEVLETQSRIVALENETQVVHDNVVQAEDGVQKAEARKDNFLIAKKTAEDIVCEAEAKVLQSEEAVKVAQVNLKEARAKVVFVEKEASQFSDEIIEEHEGKIAHLNEVLEKAVLGSETVAKSLEFMREELQKKQDALKEQGYEFNIVAPRPPKTTYL